MNLLLKLFLTFLSPIYAHTEIAQFHSNPVVLQWQDFGQEYEYVAKVYEVEESDQNLILTSDWVSENRLEITINRDGLYFWEVYIKENKKNCDEEYQCFKVESGYFEFYLEQPEETDEEADTEEEELEQKDNTVEEVKEQDSENETEKDEEEEKSEKKSKEKEDQTEVLGAETKRYIAKKQFKQKDEKEEKEEKREEDRREDRKEKVERNYCKYRYNIKKKKFTLKECNIDKPMIDSSTYYKYNDQYIVNSKGKYRDQIKVYIENTTCKNFDLFNPKTWFGCDEVAMDKNEYTVNFNHEVYFYKSNIISPSNYIFQSKKFEIATVVTDLPTDLVFKGYFSINHRGQWLDQELVFKQNTSFTEKEEYSSGIYSFPFNKIIYVNQWHGCTAYQCPHKGIDFASVREKIYAGGDGKVVTRGYDTYSGECNSGGKYLVIKYENGHHMAYMHLEKIYVNNYQQVKKGDLIALSGNSGQNNCQPLGYHLHYELRETRSQSTHIDPVPYIDINWNLVKTNKSNIFPKRLTGDNPHPSF
jgi:murein DD-endopeptidase MepM/ murein hydrolase activator NlpD